MKSLWPVMIAAVWGCNLPAETDPMAELRQGTVVLAVAGDGYVDSAQVFFFRPLATRDSLITREVVRDIGSRPARFRLSVPAGSYTVFIFGNVATDHIVASPPYSSDSVRLKYGGGEMAPVIYYGWGRINVGVDTAFTGALVLVTAQVRLSVADVPAGTTRIVAELRNTGTGAYVGAGFVEEIMRPDIRDSLTDLVAGESYTMTFSCFPTVTKYGKSVLHVDCYDRADKLTYSGDSAPFIVDSRMRKQISCSFIQSSVRNLRGSAGITGKLIWSYNESLF